jgi:hypothetical protein
MTWDGFSAFDLAFVHTQELSMRPRAAEQWKLDRHPVVDAFFCDGSDGMSC